MEEELTLEASIELLLSQVPGPVRTFVLNELGPTTSALMTKHQLHVDHGGVLERELLLMLLGQSTPDEFIASLSEAGIAEATVKSIAADVNKDIFIRLREQERKEATAPAPARTPVPIYSPLPASSVPSVPPSRVEPPPNLPGQMPEPARPVPPPPHIEVPAPVAAPQPAKEAPVPQQDPHNRIIHTMARDMEAVKSGVDPLRVAHPAPPSWAEAPTNPAPVVPPPPVVPPQPQVAHPAPPIAPPVTPPAAAVHEAPHPQEALRTHLKQYGVDPYREPVE